jgi:hypothetical protein
MTLGRVLGAQALPLASIVAPERKNSTNGVWSCAIYDTGRFLVGPAHFAYKRGPKWHLVVERSRRDLTRRVEQVRPADPTEMATSQAAAGTVDSK